MFAQTPKMLAICFLKPYVPRFLNHSINTFTRSMIRIGQRFRFHTNNININEFIIF